LLLNACYGYNYRLFKTRATSLSDHFNQRLLWLTKSKKRRVSSLIEGFQ